MGSFDNFAAVAKRLLGGSTPAGATGATATPGVTTPPGTPPAQAPASAAAGIYGANNYNASTPSFNDLGSSYQAPSSTPASFATANPYATSSADSSGYSATSVNAPGPMAVGSDQTVQGQLAGIIGKNSPLMQQAYNQAMATANDRGLINSSMAVGSAQNAVLQNALPIAQSDANTFQNTALTNFNAANQNAQFNANAANQAAQFTAGAQNTASLQNAAAANQAAQFGAQAANTASLQNAQNATQLQNTAMNNATALQQTGLSTATQRFVSQLSANSQAAIAAAHDANSAALQNSSAAQSMFNQYLTNVGNIDANPNMNEDAKRTAIETQTQIFNGAVAGLRAASPGVPDVSSALDFSKPEEASTPAKSTADNPFTSIFSSLWPDGSS